MVAQSPGHSGGVTACTAAAVKLLTRVLALFWGSILELTPHAHGWVPDGVFHLDAQGELQFHRLPPPTDRDVRDLLRVIERRVIKACSEFDETLPHDDAMTIAYAQHEASRPPLFTIPLQPRLNSRMISVIDPFFMRFDSCR